MSRLGFPVPNSSNQLERLEVAERAILLQDQSRMLKSVQAATDTMQNRLLGVPVPEDDVINLGNITINPESAPTAQPPARKTGLSTAAALALGLLTAAVPAAGVIGYLLKAAPAAVEKVIEKPGTNYDVKVGMEIIPPG